jgi:hypothetical protein
MRRLTLREVTERHGGVLPPDAMFEAEAGPEDPVAAKSKGPRKEESKGKRNGKPAPKSNRTRGSRFAVFNAFVDFTMASLTGAQRDVWLILFRDTKADTQTARTGQADMARRANLSVRAVKYAVKALQKKGLLKVVHRGRLNGGPSIYRVFATATHGEP